MQILKNKINNYFYKLLWFVECTNKILESTGSSILQLAQTNFVLLETIFTLDRYYLFLKWKSHVPTSEKVEREINVSVDIDTKFAISYGLGNHARYKSMQNVFLHDLSRQTNFRIIWGYDTVL